jgi:hypothetical protein
MQWPSEAVVRKIAHNAATAETHLHLNEPEIYDYISRAVLGSEPIDDVFFAVETAFTLPVLITASMLLTFCPRDKEWWEYLDAIWNAIESAAAVDMSVLPALMLRARRTAGGAQESAPPARLRVLARTPGGCASKTVAELKIEVEVEEQISLGS